MKDGVNVYASNPENRNLAVEGNNVYIAVCDDNKISYLQSADNGSTFSAPKIIGPGTLPDDTYDYYSVINTSIKVAGEKVAVVYLNSGYYNGQFKTRMRMLFSGNNGSTFSVSPISAAPSNEPTQLSDFWFDGNQMVVVHEYAYFFNGLNVGRVYVSVSNNNGASFVTNKISPSYTDQSAVYEKSRCYHNVHYSAKIAKSGNNIHVIFVGCNENGVWTTLYARSTNNGQTFEKAKDVNDGAIASNAIQSAQETIAARNGMVYIVYMSTAGKALFLQSTDNGASFTKARSILPDGYSYVESTWYPSLVIDPGDATGSTVYLAGQLIFSAVSTDGGKTFSGFSIGSPLLDRNITHMISDMAIDSKGTKHWISDAKWWGGTDRDIFYRSAGNQPDPGIKNKALAIETTNSPQKLDLVVVPSSQSIDFDSAMTAEAWVKFDLRPQDGGSLFAKVNGADSHELDPNGYQMGFRKTSGKICINSGIQTDKGDFVNWCDCNIGDTLWHYLAFTYDSKSGPKNFKTYIDGLLQTEQTVTGKIKQGNGLLMIGSRMYYLGETRYQVDNLRLWNRALTQDELLKNKGKNPIGKEPGLKLFINFDDTFKDISGNGNDALPIYFGELKNVNSQITSIFYTPKPPMIEENLTVYPNPASGELKVTISNPPRGIYVVELLGINGTMYHSMIYNDYSIGAGVPINLKNCAPGQ